jgi:hypothetical protein
MDCPDLWARWTPGLTQWLTWGLLTVKFLGRHVTVKFLGRHLTGWWHLMVWHVTGWHLMTWLLTTKGSLTA